MLRRGEGPSPALSKVEEASILGCKGVIILDLTALNLDNSIKFYHLVGNEGVLDLSNPKARLYASRCYHPWEDPLTMTKSVIIDCDVLQADGGTRTASVTGAYVALYQALATLTNMGVISSVPLNSAVAAVSVGIVHNDMLLDLCYDEDYRAAVDFNVVMTGKGEFVEIQGTAEGKPFSKETVDSMLALAIPVALQQFISAALRTTFTLLVKSASTTGSVPRLAGAASSVATWASPATIVGLACKVRESDWLGRPT
jgi:hypothetical protein